MAAYQVTCITKHGGHRNPHERIEYIGNEAGKWRFSENDVIRRIEKGIDSFFTSVKGKQVDLVVADHNGRKYLKTVADGYEPNNLLSLPECTSACKISS